MKTLFSISLVVAVCLMIASLAMFGQQVAGKTDSTTTNKAVSFKQHVFPIFKKHCLPCHAEDNFNPSQLSLDSYENMMAGGKHGVPVKPGKSAESILIEKLGPDPPFGDVMPLDPRKKKAQPMKPLPEDDIRAIATWIDQGAKNN